MRRDDFAHSSSFDTVLNRIAGTVRERRWSFVLSVGLALIAIAILAIYAVKQQSTFRHPTEDRALISLPKEEKEPSLQPKDTAVPTPPPKPVKHRRPRRGPDRLMLAIKSLSEWRSPTGSLLNFPGEDFLKGLPKLGESLEKTKSLATEQFN